ncbi:MAG: leucine-rich repeat domain-containing protein, partial [Cyanobacteria bacterium J06648_11]
MVETSSSRAGRGWDEYQGTAMQPLSYRTTLSLSLVLLAALQGCGSPSQPLAVFPVPARADRSSRSEAVANTPAVSLVLDNNRGSVTLNDAAIASVLLNVPNGSQLDSEAIAIAANALLRSPNTVDPNQLANPLMLDEVNFVDPNASGVDRRDIAILLASVSLGNVSEVQELANGANRLLPDSDRISPTLVSPDLLALVPTPSPGATPTDPRIFPSPSPTPSVTPTASPSPDTTPTASPNPGITPTPTPSPTSTSQPTATPEPTPNSDVVSFSDRELEQVVLEALGQSSGPVTRADAESLTFLNAAGRGLDSLEGIEALTSLTGLDLFDNNLTDLRPLATLSSLTALDIGSNSVDDVSPLTGLIGLSDLSLVDNVNLSSIDPLSSLTQLQRLFLSGNRIADINALSAMTNLEEVILSDNNIDDLSPLANLTQLRGILASSNDIQTLEPLRSLTQLRTLNLFNNRISTLDALEDLSELHFLILSTNDISD